MNFTIQPHLWGTKNRVSDYGKLKIRGTYLPVIRDVMDVIPESDWLDIIRDPNKPECSSLAWYTNDQNGNGSCASEAANKGTEVVREASGREKVAFNPLFTYHTVSGGRDSGSSLDDNVAFVKEYGCCPESVYPRSKGFRAKPPEEAYAAAENYKADEIYDVDNSSSTVFKQEFGSALLYGYPVDFGIPGHSILATELVEEDPSNPYMSQCANMVQAYIDSCRRKAGFPRYPKQDMDDLPKGVMDNVFIKYKNSWGDWGDNGFGYVKFRSVQRSYGAFVWRTARAESL